jgi:hypothetical protein
VFPFHCVCGVCGIRMNVGHGGMWEFLSSPSLPSLQGWVLLLLYPLISSAAFRFFFHLFSGLWFPSEQLAFCPTTTSSLSFTIFHSLFFFPVTSLVGLEDGFLCDKLRNWKWLVVIGVSLGCGTY